METQCCEQIYCETCIQPLVGKDCPSCRQPNLRTKVSKIIRRMSGDLPVECPNKCGEKVTRDGLINHREKCPQREYRCPIKDCEFIGIKTEFIKHTGEKHSDSVIAGLRSLTTVAETSDISVQTEAMEKKDFYCPFEGCDQDAVTVMTRAKLREHIYQKHHKEKEWFKQVFHSGIGPIQIINLEGRFANMACNGKFYCGVKKGSYSRQNDKTIKPSSQRIPCSFDSGLNCWSCMKLDVTFRNLPYGLLVNAAGRVSTPNYCNHSVGDSEYFAQNFGRSALCTQSSCEVTPKFSCKMAEPSTCCKEDMCEDCEALWFVCALAWTNGVEKGLSVEYYKPVWVKNKA